MASKKGSFMGMSSLSKDLPALTIPDIPQTPAPPYEENSFNPYEKSLYNPPQRTAYNNATYQESIYAASQRTVFNHAAYNESIYPQGSPESQTNRSVYPTESMYPRDSLEAQIKRSIYTTESIYPRDSPETQTSRSIYPAESIYPRDSPDIGASGNIYPSPNRTAGYGSASLYQSSPDRPAGREIYAEQFMGNQYACRDSLVSEANTLEQAFLEEDAIYSYRASQGLEDEYLKDGEEAGTVSREKPYRAPTPTTLPPRRYNTGDNPYQHSTSMAMSPVGRSSTRSSSSPSNKYEKSLPPLPGENKINNKLPFGVETAMNLSLKYVQLNARGFFYVKRRVDGDKTKPNFTKRYPIHPRLKNRIFVPPVSAAPPPLYLDIHGGAWVTCDPSFDDKANTENALKWRCLIVSLDYSKAPEAFFPTPLNELVDLILAVLKDESLIFDRSRVAIGGYSAGANLALGAVQDLRLQGKIHACVPFYPICDWTQSAKTRASTRKYEKGSDVDLLMKIGPISTYFFNYVYCQGGADLKDSRLSPAFAKREELPEWIFAMGAEYDMLSNETAAMMGRFAKRELRMVGGLYKGKVTDKTEGLLEQDRRGFEAEGGRLKWKMIDGIEHGWTHSLPLKTGYAEVLRQEKEQEAFKLAGDWLWGGPYKVESVETQFGK